jgi:formylglycine-generating enzyme required for sulfatase activity
MTQGMLSDLRHTTDDLFRLIPESAIYDRPIGERHRIIFYVGHVEAFDWNLLRDGSAESELDRLFAFGIDPEVGKGPADIPGDWPSLANTLEYVAKTRALVDGAAERALDQLLHVAIEHRLMHAETLAYMLHQQPYSHKLRCSDDPAREYGRSGAEMIDIPEGKARLGCENGFGWDNEFAAHEQPVPAFRAARYKVTNGDYLQFVREGAQAPAFWIRRGDGWLYRGMFREVPLPLEWPVYVTHDQARAFASWKGMRLPTEAEFHSYAYGATPEAEGGNLDFKRWDPVPVTAGPANGFGISQSVSNGWEWTSTAFGPFDGFRAFPFYPGYSANFFDGEHYVMKGASPRTARKLARPSFRNWFRHDYPYMYGTFRLVDA